MLATKTARAYTYSLDSTVYLDYPCLCFIVLIRIRSVNIPVSCTFYNQLQIEEGWQRLG